MRGSLAASVVRNAIRPNAWMKEVAHVELGAPLVCVAQLANADNLFAVPAHAAIASALSSSCEAFRSWTRSALASIEKPSTDGSLKTVGIGAAFAVSLKMLRMLAAYSAADRRQSFRGPGAPLVHGLGAANAVGSVSVVDPPVGLDPSAPLPPSSAPASGVPWKPRRPLPAHAARSREATGAKRGKNRRIELEPAEGRSGPN